METTTLPEIMKALFAGITASAPGSTQANILILIGIMSLVVCLGLTAPRFGCKLTPWARVVIIVAVGVALSLIGVIALRVLVIPSIASAAAGIAIQAIVPIIVCLVVVAPMCALMLKGSYVQSLLTTLFTVIGAILIVIAIRAAWNAVSHSESVMEVERDRKKAMEIEMNQ